MHVAPSFEASSRPAWRRVLAALGAYDVWLIALLMMALATALSPLFLTPLNLENLLRQSAIIGLLAIGQFLVILTGGFDLSVGAVLALSSVLVAQLSATSLPLALLAGVGAGALLGLANGLVVTRGRIPPFVATLAMLGIARGLAFAVSENSVTLRDATLRALNAGVIGFVPALALVWLLIAALVAAFLQLTPMGLHIYAVGGREETARLAGVDVARTKLLVYTLAGCLAGVAGILFAARSSSGMPHVGAGWELDSIAAVVIGGVSLAGGRGSLAKAMAGVLVYMAIRNLMNLLGMDPYFQDMLKAGIILAAVGLRVRSIPNRGTL
jgi:ribose/xylose/arabinose/galactoside ABC-type transport system permease subunit